MTKVTKVQSGASHVHLEIVLSCDGHCGQNSIQLRHGRRGHGAHGATQQPSAAENGVVKHAHREKENDFLAFRML